MQIRKMSRWKGRIAQVALMSVFVGILHGQVHTAPEDALRRGFAHPLSAAKLRCYWWWLNGNTTEATITRDLTEMSRKGFGGVLLVDANGSNQEGNVNVPPGPIFGSPAWVKLYLHALKTAASLHLEVTLNATSGWNLGGPDVTPSDASKLLTWSRTTVNGGGFDGVLPMPPIKNGFYGQIAVLAYPLSHGAALPGEEGAGRAAIESLQYKTASVETGFSMPPSEPLLEDVPASEGEQDTQTENVINLTARIDAAGKLNWHPPTNGVWEILRIGYTDSGVKVSTSSGAWQGLAIDYLDRGAFDKYWEHTIAPLLTVARPYLGTTLRYLATDSWEVGGTNWTGRFAVEFRRRRGYDPVPFLPVIAGRIVQDRSTSDQFLNDLRRTVGDLITDHFDHFAERANEYGLGTQCESGGPHGAPVDALETFRSGAIPQTEFWAQSNEHRSSDEERFFAKEVASAANIYGKKFAADEGMTSMGPHWSESLATDLKPTFDRALTEGMNRLVWHEFTSIPESFGVPGIEYFAGTHINPNVTWWKQSGAFFLYLNRSQFLLQQGHAVDDVLYFYGDQAPNFVRLKHDDPAHVLPGYDYDVTDEDALLRTLSIHAGTISTPSGNDYKILVLPQSHRLGLAALERIALYVRQGGNIVGLPPTGATGIVDERVSKRATELTKGLWGSCSPAPHAYGAGHIFCDTDTHAALRYLKVKPDFEDASGTLDYAHRRDGVNDIYYVRNGTSQPINTVVKFRVEGRQPELWDPVNGHVKPQAYYQADGGMTRIPLRLAPFGSVFVVFMRPAGPHVNEVFKGTQRVESVGVIACGGKPCALENAPSGRYILHVTDGRQLEMQAPEITSQELPAEQWSIAFQDNRGAPTGIQKLRSFSSWTEWPDPGVRYFSGTATYRTEIDGAHAAGDHVILVLSDVHEICSVRLNGKPVGTIWAMPYRLDLTADLANGKNTLELDVTNLWANRIIGDAQPGNPRTYTSTNIRKYKDNSPLLRSGLIGPVSIEKVHVPEMSAVGNTGEIH